MASVEGYIRASARAGSTITSRRRALPISGSATAQILTPGSTICIEAIIAAARCPSPITASLVMPGGSDTARSWCCVSSQTVPIVSELLPGGFEGAVHDHHDREAVFVGTVLVDGVAIRQPAHDPFPFQRRVVSVALPERDDGQQFVEDFGQLGHGRLLLPHVEARGSLDDQLLQVHFTEGFRILRQIVGHPTARRGHVIR